MDPTTAIRAAAVHRLLSNHYVNPQTGRVLGSDDADAE
jgi:hypothetical protein